MVIDRDNFKLKMVWDRIKSSWFYYPEEIKFQELSGNVVIHEVRVVSGVITFDTFDPKSIGQLFKKHYAHVGFENKGYYFY